MKAAKPPGTRTRIKLEFSRDTNAAIFIFRTPRRCALESFGTLLQKQHGERSSENETMTIYPDSLEQRWPLGMFWLSLSMHCQRDEEGDRKTRRIKTGCWQSETCLQVPDVFCTYNFFPCLILFMHNSKLLIIMLLSVITCLNTMNSSSYQLVFRQCIRYWENL